MDLKDYYHHEIRIYYSDGTFSEGYFEEYTPPEEDGGDDGCLYIELDGGTLAGALERDIVRIEKI